MDYPLGNAMACHGEDFATSVARTVGDNWPSRDELRTQEAQSRARQGLPDPGYRESVEPKHVAKKLAKLDPTEKEIYGYTNSKGQRVPGLTHEVRTQGFMLIRNNPASELEGLSEQELSELAAEQEEIRTLATEGKAEFFPAWNAETFVARRQHNPAADFRQRRPEEDGVELRECSESEMMAGLN